MRGGGGGGGYGSRPAKARVDPATRSRRSARFRGSAGGANGAGGLRHASWAAGYAGEVGGSRQPRPLRRVEPIVEGWREHPPVAGAGGHIARVKVRGGDRARAASTGDPLVGWSRRVLARVAGGSRLRYARGWVGGSGRQLGLERFSRGAQMFEQTGGRSGGHVPTLAAPRAHRGCGYPSCWTRTTFQPSGSAPREPPKCPSASSTRPARRPQGC